MQKSAQLQLFLALSLIPIVPAHAEDDPIKWAWICRSSGFYEINVLPDGKYAPAFDPADYGALNVRVKEAGKETKEFCEWEKYLHSYYIELDGNQLASLYDSSPCKQQVNLSFKTHSPPTSDDRDLENLDSNIKISSPMSLLVHKDDNEWRFVLSLTGLTTSKEGRELRIKVPQPQIHYDAKADVSMLTGECIMTTGQ